MTTRTVFSLREVRLANTSGHACVVPARKPKTIPEALFLDAVRLGCVEYSAAMIEALRAVSADSPPASEAPELNAMMVAEQAVKQVLMAGDAQPELLTSTGVPRVPAVRAAYEMLCADVGIDTPDLKITQDLVTALFEQVTAEDQEPEEQPVSQPRDPETGLGDLEGEEVGGLDLEGFGGDYDAEE